MTKSDLAWYLSTTCAAAFLLWPMFTVTAIVDKTRESATAAAAITCALLAVIVVHGLHSLWWAATHGLVGDDWRGT